jgi:hypothetical protein
MRHFGVNATEGAAMSMKVGKTMNAVMQESPPTDDPEEVERQNILR